MISLGDALLRIGIDKSEFEQGLQEVENRAKQTQQTFRALERVTRPLGVALVGLGAAGLTAAEATKDWNNALGESLQRLKPVFASLTAIGGVMITLPPMIRGVKVAFDLLKVAAASTAGVLGIVGMSIGAVGLLVYGLTRLFPSMHADTQRWTTALEGANDQLVELEKNGRGSSAEAEVLRTAIDDLTLSLAHFDDVGNDNVVTANNLESALQKLADATAKLDKVGGKLPDTIQRMIDSGTKWGDIIGTKLQIMIGDTASDVVELTTNILKLKDAEEEELATARDESVKALEKLYGFRADETTSLLEMYEDEVDARQDSLNDQLDAVRKSTNDVIKQYRREYDAKVKLLDDETDAQVEALERQLGILDDSQEAADNTAEDEADAKTETELRLAVSQAWNRKDRATAEAALAKFLEDKAKKLADRQREAARESLQNQIRDVQSAADKKRAEYQQELNDKTETENAKLEASEITIQAELNSLQTAANIKRGILLQEFNDAVAVQNRIRDNAIAAINTVIAAQIYAANVSSVPLTAQGAIDMQSGIDYENWAASSGGGIRRYANGGPVLEDSLLVGMRSGKPYAMAHAGETVTPKGNGGITITGNTFNVRTDADIPRIAAELLRQRMLKGSFGS